MTVTLKALAELSGCSIRTVNRVIWHSGPVAAEKRERIEALLQEHHYVPNMAARNLKQSRRKFAGVIINEGTTVQIFLRKLSDLVNTLEGQGLYPLLGRPVSDSIQLECLMSEWTGLVNHIIFMYMPNAQICAKLTELSERYGMHFTIIDAEGAVPAGCSALRVDRGAGITEAIMKLYAMGHRRIMRVGNVETRDSGWKNARAKLRHKECFAHMVIQPECDIVETATTAIFGGQPDAIVCDTDRAAAGILRAATQKGIAIPENVSLVGFDDDPMATMLTPRLASIAHPLEEINTAAAEIVACGDNFKCIDKTFPTRFILRDSVRAR
jgi:LacI family transcriptional regulator